MKRALLWIGAGVLTVLFVGPQTQARAEFNYKDGKIIAGAELGVVVPTNAFDRFSDAGGGISPYVGWMYEDVMGWPLDLGMVGAFEAIGAPNKNREGILDDDATWAISGGGGPRMAIPLSDDVELWADFQGRWMSGLTPNGSITDTSGGFSTGGGLHFPVTETFSVGAFGRWARQYQRIHTIGDVRYVFAGISLDYKEAPPPPPPPVAKAPPPPAPRAAKKKIVLRGVNFDFDKSNIRADAAPVLDEAISILGGEGTVNIVSAGHTDSVGTEQYNAGLSMRRANAVRDYLIKGGLDASRITVEGFGESQPVASNDTAEGRAQNRRVELKVSGVE